MNTIFKRLTAGGTALCLMLSLTTLPAFADDETTADAATPAATETTSGGNTDTPLPEEPESPQPEDPDASQPDEPGDSAGSVNATLTSAHVRYLGGYEDRSVRPERQVTRAEAAAIIYRLLENADSGSGTCSYTDVKDSDWFANDVRALCRLGLLDDGTTFRPNDAITRAEIVDLLVRLAPETRASASFSDVPADYWAAKQIAIAASLGWVGGYEDGTFRPENGLTRAEACSIINRVTARSGDSAQAQKLMGLGLYTDITNTHWAAVTIAEASIAHEQTSSGSGETWSGINLADYTFTPGVHNIAGQLYSVDRYGKLALNKAVGAYWADANGVLTQTASAYQVGYVPYISQIDGIYAWVGCEPVSALMGLKALGYAQDVSVTTYLNNLPFSASNPEWGFVGSPYVVNNSLRTTIYPAALAKYCNTYCNGASVCADFRGASVEELRQELLAGNMVVAYETLWWEQPRYRNYWIDGQLQSLVYNNHAILVYGYDPARGYLVSDPYNYYNRGQTYQYWENAATFDNIWNQRKVGMVMR